MAINIQSDTKHRVIALQNLEATLRYLDKVQYLSVDIASITSKTIKLTTLVHVGDFGERMPISIVMPLYTTDLGTFVVLDVIRTYGDSDSSYIVDMFAPLFEAPTLWRVGKETTSEWLADDSPKGTCNYWITIRDHYLGGSDYRECKLRAKFTRFEVGAYPSQLCLKHSRMIASS